MRQLRAVAATGAAGSLPGVGRDRRVVVRTCPRPSCGSTACAASSRHAPFRMPVACAAAFLPTAGKGRLALRGGAISLKATASAGPKHVTTKSAEIMEEAMVSRMPVMFLRCRVARCLECRVVSARDAMSAPVTTQPALEHLVPWRNAPRQIDDAGTH